MPGIEDFIMAALAEEMQHDNEKEHNYVVVGELLPEEVKQADELMKVKASLIRLKEEADICMNKGNITKRQMMHGIEDRLKVPGYIPIQVDARTKQILMPREAAEHLNIPFNVRGSSEHDEANQVSFSDQ